MTATKPLADRIASLLDHLGLERAHFATQMPGDLAELASRHADRMGSLCFVVPVRLDPIPFVPIGSRVLIVTGDSGVSVDASERGAGRLAGSVLHRLERYVTTGWSDIAKERGEELAAVMVRHLAQCEVKGPRASIPSRIPSEGAHDGITWQAEGAGPALMLLPFFLAPSQWAPVVPILSQSFTVIQIGGAHVGGVAILEDRASRPSYRAMFRFLLDLLAIGPGARVLDVGCGSGALARAAAHQLAPSVRIDAIDVNAFLLSEARDLARVEGCAGTIVFSDGSAEAIPFQDETFDAAYSVTVLEECDADRALAEMRRVVRPGGRVGVIVRAIDMPQWWSLDVPQALRSRAFEPPQSVGPRGVADKSLYTRLRAAGLTDVVPFPSLITLDNPGSTVWRYREDHLLAQMSPDELQGWQVSRGRALQGGLLFNAHPMHCAVGRRPG